MRPGQHKPMRKTMNATSATGEVTAPTAGSRQLAKLTTIEAVR